MINTTDTHSAPVTSARLSLRVKEANPLHHLWNNNGTWWIHYTLHLPDYTAKRVRRSLRTGVADEAIRRRDDLLNQISLAPTTA